MLREIGRIVASAEQRRKPRSSTPPRIPRSYPRHMAASIALAYKTWMRPPRLLFAWLTLAVGIFAAGAARADDFWTPWGDGKAELDGYALIQPRYGRAARRHRGPDLRHRGFLRLGCGSRPTRESIRRATSTRCSSSTSCANFRPGSTLRVLSSTFARTEPVGGAPWPLVKTSFSSQEWCGHVYQQWLPRGGLARGDACTATSTARPTSSRS